MELSVSHQLFVVICMFLCGGVTGIVFDLFRGYRRCVKSGSGVIAAQDLLFWFAEFLIVYYTAFKVNNAKIRAYEIISLFCGAVIYFVTLSEHMVKAVSKITAFVLKISDAALFPLKKAAQFIFKPLKKLFSTGRRKLLSLKNSAKDFAIEKKKAIGAILQLKKRKK